MASISSAITSSSDDREVRKIVASQASNGIHGDITLYGKMLAVVAVPVLAVVASFSVALKQSYDQRNNAFQQVSNFNYDMIVDNLISSLRWERGAASTFTVYGGKDVATNIRVANYRNQTDLAITALPWWPEGIVVNGSAISSPAVMKAMLAVMRKKVDTLMINYNDVLDMYSMITASFMSWLQVDTKKIILQRAIYSATNSARIRPLYL
jgi:hypothetical protein